MNLEAISTFTGYVACGSSVSKRAIACVVVVNTCSILAWWITDNCGANIDHGGGDECLVVV